MIKNLALITLASALFLGVASNAQATFIATAINEVTNFNIDGISSITSPTTSTVSIASWDAFPVGDVDPLDAQLSSASTSGPPPLPQNNFTMLADGTSSWARGDTLISNTDLLGGTGAASNVAEAQVEPDVSGLSVASATGASSLAFVFSIGTGGGTVDISFNADPYLEVGISLDDAISAEATASTNFIIDITDASGANVFLWAPDLLNGEVFINDDDSTVVDTPASLYENSVFLAEGSYSFAWEMRTRVVALQDGDNIPEPNTVALLSLGLVGLGFTRRKMKV